ncbi:MAG: Ig-like domain-containing protein [Erysipelotrichaceae bacterium]|nr:Ig-like domain-containing protein [Erysipelotrichaceae bacterium]
MHPISLKKIALLLLCALLTLTCSACQREEIYTKSEYLREFCLSSGLSQSDTEEAIAGALSDWKIPGDHSPEDPLDNGFLLSTLDILLDGQKCPLLDERRNLRTDTPVSRKDAEKLLKAVLDVIDHREFASFYQAEEKEGILPYTEDLSSYREGDVLYDEEEDAYYKVSEKEGEKILEEAGIEDIYEEFSISGSFETDFEEAEVIPYITSSSTHYTNTRYELLASPSKSHSFEFRGFTVTCTLSGTSLSVSARKVTGGNTIYADFLLTSVHPSYRWNYKEGLRDAYFKVDFKTAETAGLRREKSGTFVPSGEGINVKKFLSSISSFLKPKGEGEAVSIPVCQIMVPVPEMPSISLMMDLSIRIYVGGKAEIALTHDHLLGFEVREGKFRTISDHDHDIRGVLNGDVKLSSMLSLALYASKSRLMDLGIDGGISGKVATILHLYDEEGKKTTETVEGDYEAIAEMASACEDVKVCADLSLNWLLSLTLNSSKSVLGKMGFSFRLPLLTQKDQIFGNMTHMEDGHFVPACTRKDRKKKDREKAEEIDSERLIPEADNLILKAGENYAITYKKIPEGYKREDLVYSSESPDVASVIEGKVSALHKGNTRIKVSTVDGKYSIYLHVLVSG